jgi:hypothetical protein
VCAQIWADTWVSPYDDDAVKMTGRYYVGIPFTSRSQALPVNQEKCRGRAAFVAICIAEQQPMSLFVGQAFQPVAMKGRSQAGWKACPTFEKRTYLLPGIRCHQDFQPSIMTGKSRKVFRPVPDLNTYVAFSRWLFQMSCRCSSGIVNVLFSLFK